MTDDELETRLRDALAARDPGLVAPRELRDRVGRLASSAPSRASLTARSSRDVMTLLATAAAIVVGIVAINALRTATAPAIGPGSAPSPSPSFDAGHTVATVAAPVTLDWGPIAGLLALLIGVTWFALEMLTTKAWLKPGVPAPDVRFKRGFGWLGTAILRRLAFGGALVAALAYPSAVGLVSHVDTGDSSGGYSSDHILGRRTGYDHQKDVLYYWGPAGATISVEFSIRNSGSVPVTILGTTQPTYGPDGIELRRFAVEEPNSYPPVDGTATVPFVPFELQPNESRGLLFVYSVGPCRGAYSPSPTPTPLGTPDLENYVPTRGDGTVGRTFTQVDIRTSELGLDRTTSIDLGTVISILSPQGCP